MLDNGYDRGESSSAAVRDKLIWKGIWKLKVKGKVQHFLWSCCNNTLAVGSNLLSRGIPIDPRCKLCGEELESEEHLFLLCPAVKHIWELAPVKWDGLDAYTYSFKEWCFHMMKVGSTCEGQRRIQFSVFLLWNIWKWRNNWLFNTQFLSQWEVVNKAMEEWLEYEAHCQVLPSQIHHTRVQQQLQWSKPAEGVIKLNVSALFQQYTGITGVGIVARDCRGSLLQVWAVARDRLQNPVVATLDAVRVALIFAQMNLWKNVQVELEVKNLVDCLNDKRCPIRRIYFGGKCPLELEGKLPPLTTRGTRKVSARVKKSIGTEGKSTEKTSNNHSKPKSLKTNPTHAKTDKPPIIYNTPGPISHPSAPSGPNTKPSTTLKSNLVTKKPNLVTKMPNPEQKPYLGPTVVPSPSSLNPSKHFAIKIKTKRPLTSSSVDDNPAIGIDEVTDDIAMIE
ncbi:OLC1v1036028C1 [Oldenlandia corymbosa var. corymbosa]|uniref:OLC1v1036028C1 n=1 Tax=Oldenlandia corymbosa var. corymbosa TaxID=529605 RepID=A0AAV1CVR1_OLDCO|nr:OLC1v1036028C1 [Oldenlandia corymbosa var. corymbosa]